MSDFYQLNPVTGTFLASNPLDVPAGSAQRPLQLFWQTRQDSVRSFWQLAELMRCDEVWYNLCWKQCRVGNLSMENYRCFHGHPTLKSPRIGECRCNEDVEEDDIVGPYRKTWKERFWGGYADMDALQTRQRSSLKSVEQSACPIHIQSAEVLGDNPVRERVCKAKGRATPMVLCAR